MRHLTTEVPTTGSFVFKYINGEDFHSRSNYTSDVTVVAKYSVVYEETTNLSKVALKLTPGVITKRTGPLGNEYTLLDNPDVIKAHFIKTLKSLRSVTSYMNQSGEFNVKWDSDSVQASYLRTLGLYKGGNNKSTLVKSKTYKFPYNGEVLPVKVSVFPYRGKSKVTWETQIPVKFSTDGTVDLNPNFIDIMVNRLKEIANS